MAALDGADGGASCARRRRERRFRAFWRHEQFAVRCTVVTATHHSANKAHRFDAETQTEERIQHRTVEQIVHCPLQQVVIPQERNSERIMEQDRPVPTHLPSPEAAGRSKVWRPRLPLLITAPATVIKYVASSLAFTCAAPPV